MKTEARLIAFYLPQYHPIPENDEWWGKGFTEWTNVAKAEPLFRGHYQPRLPADLGYYDLRVPEVREAQAELARNAGIEGFCYYHYWFGGKRLLQRPFNEVVASGKPNFPFCLCWANQTWTGIWHGAPGRTLMEQTYPGVEDYQEHFSCLRTAFLDARYIRVNGRPIFVIYQPMELPNPSRFISAWQELAVHNGLPGFHFVAHLTPDQLGWEYRSHGFDSCVVVNTHKVFGVSLRHRLFGTNENGLHGNLGQSWRKKDTLWHSAWRRYRSSLGRFSNVRLYREAVPFLLDGCAGQEETYPCVIPNWDNTPRSQRRGYVLHDSTPELFRIHLHHALSLVRSRPVEDRLVFIKSWNEWAEGNYLEPDRRFGHDYLKVVSEVVTADTVEERSAGLTTLCGARVAT